MEMENLFESDQNLEQVDEDDEIYEKIEAPKYVDFTRDDQFLPDDRSWFCMRIGCDQNHEDVDPDALHKSFVLRVMAARSPNIRLRKALRSREVPSAYMKCPKSAPAKPSKPKICRFAAMTSISQKMVDVKVKARPVSKSNLTPTTKPREYSAAAKSLTTPRVKKCIPSADHFRSVQNPKTTDAALKNKMVAKALVFNTPKKSARKQSSLESETPMTEICDGMKKLQINSQRKKLSWDSSKQSRCNASRPKKHRNASDPSTSELNSQKLKSRVKGSERRKDQGVQSVKYTKSTSKSSPKFTCPRPHSIANSDMEIDGESRNGSLGVCSVSETSRSNEVTGSGEETDFVLTTLGIPVTTQEECSEETVTGKGGIEVINEDQNGREPDLKVSEERDYSAGVTNATAKALVFKTPKRIEGDKLLKSETPLTEICDGMNKLVINSQRKKSSRNSTKSSMCAPNRPKKSSITDPSTSKLHSQKLRSRVNDSADLNAKGVKSSEYMKSATAKCLAKFSCPRPQSRANSDMEIGRLQCVANSDMEIGGMKNEGDKNEDHPDLKTSSIGDNVQTALADISSDPNASSLSNSERVFEEDNLPNIRILNGKGGIEASKGDEHGNGLDLKISDERDDSVGVAIAIASDNGHNEGSCGDDEHRRGLQDVSVLGTSHSVGSDKEIAEPDDKENTAISDSNRNSDLYNHQSQTNNLQSEVHEKQQKVISAPGKALKGNSVASTNGLLPAKYKKTKATNPRPFRLRTDERGILREANLEKRHLPASLAESTTVSRDSEGSFPQRRHKTEKVTVHGQFRHESVSQEGNQIELDKQNQKIQRQQTRPIYHKTSKCALEPKTAKVSTQEEIRSKHLTDKEAKKREHPTTKSQLLRQQYIRTQSRGTGTRKTTISRRLSVIMETSSTILRRKDLKSRNKGAISVTVLNAGRSSSQAKKPLTIPKGPNSHKTHTPKSKDKTATKVFHTPKSCAKTLTEEIAS